VDYSTSPVQYLNVVSYHQDFTAWDFLMYVAALKGLSEKQAHKKATELLEAVDLAEKRNLKIKTFSGGMIL